MPSERALPSGTLTFLFTDIEGSTRLVQRLGDRYGDVLAEHHRVLRAAFAAHGGHEIGTAGDSFFVVFTRARAAVDAAVDAQRGLAQGRWPDGSPVRVRIGLHSGEGVIASDDYTGLGVHRAARISAIAHGEQVLLSNAARELVKDDLPAGVRLRDLGEVVLKDFDDREHVHQLVADGLRADFPPLKTRPARRHRRLLVAAAAVAALAIAALAAVLIAGGSSDGDSSVAVTGNSVAGVDPAGNRIVLDVPVGRSPASVAVGERAVWAVNVDDQTISRLDPATGAVRSFSVGATPFAVTVGAGSVWVTTAGEGARPSDYSASQKDIVRIDPASTGVIQRIPLPESSGTGLNATPTGVVAGGGSLWVVNDGGRVARIDPTQNRVVGTVPRLQAKALAFGEGALWALTQTDEVAKIDPRTARVTARTRVAATGLDAIAVGRDVVWAADAADGTLWRIDHGGPQVVTRRSRWIRA